MAFKISARPERAVQDAQQYITGLSRNNSRGGLSLLDNQFLLSSNKTPPGTHLAGLRRGLCFAEIARMMSFSLPPGGNGALDLAMASAISSSTSGRANTPADSRRIKRV